MQFRKASVWKDMNQTLNLGLIYGIIYPRLNHNLWTRLKLNVSHARLTDARLGQWLLWLQDQFLVILLVDHWIARLYHEMKKNTLPDIFHSYIQFYYRGIGEANSSHAHIYSKRFE